MPESAEPGAALVVVLHGCTQNAAGYDESSGWSRLAEQHGFLLLYPEQQRLNNLKLCFNWFSPDDAAREKGEALSIRQMIKGVQGRHGTDPQRVFVRVCRLGAQWLRPCSPPIRRFSLAVR